MMLTDTQATGAYGLAADVYVCFANRHIVFSDLRSDRYRCLSEENSKIVLQVMPAAEPRTSGASATLCAKPNGGLEQLMTVLENEGLVSKGATGKPFAPIQVPVPAVSLLTDTQLPESRTSLRHFLRFMQASAMASAKLRTQAMQRITAQVESRRPVIGGNHRPHVLRELAKAFHRMRPYYPRAYLCRFDSLALVDFLAAFDCYPRWVFGVRCEPFGAHCWVQDGDHVLNDATEVVREYTPIMAF